MWDMDGHGAWGAVLVAMVLKKFSTSWSVSQRWAAHDSTV